MEEMAASKSRSRAAASLAASAFLVSAAGFSATFFSAAFGGISIKWFVPFINPEMNKGNTVVIVSANFHFSDAQHYEERWDKGCLRGSVRCQVSGVRCCRWMEIFTL